MYLRFAEDFELNDQEQIMRNAVLQEMEEFIRETYPGKTSTLFYCCVTVCAQMFIESWNMIWSGEYEIACVLIKLESGMQKNYSSLSMYLSN